MKKKKNPILDDLSYFYKELKDVKKMKQDTVFHNKPYKLYQKNIEKRNICNEDAHIQFFNTNSYKNIIKKNSISYVRENSLNHELIKLKNKVYLPEITVDFHGLNQLQAKKELGKIIILCCEQKIFCFSVIHGHGKNILKNQIPIWLSNHPNVLSFCQLQKKFKKNTTLYVLIDYNNHY